MTGKVDQLKNKKAPSVKLRKPDNLKPTSTTDVTDSSIFYEQEAKKAGKDPVVFLTEKLREYESLNVEPGLCFTSEKPLVTGGLGTCSALVIRCGNKNFLAHVTAYDHDKEKARLVESIRKEYPDIQNQQFTLCVLGGVDLDEETVENKESSLSCICGALNELGIPAEKVEFLGFANENSPIIGVDENGVFCYSQDGVEPSFRSFEQAEAVQNAQIPSQQVALNYIQAHMVNSLRFQITVKGDLPYVRNGSNSIESIKNEFRRLLGEALLCKEGEAHEGLHYFISREGAKGYMLELADELSSVCKVAVAQNHPEIPNALKTILISYYQLESQIPQDNKPNPNKK